MVSQDKQSNEVTITLYESNVPIDLILSAIKRELTNETHPEQFHIPLIVEDLDVVVWHIEKNMPY